MRKLGQGYRLLGVLLVAGMIPLGLGCAGGPHPVRTTAVGSAKAVGKGTVWVAKKTGQGVVYVAKAGGKAVKSIGPDAMPDAETVVQVGDKPAADGKAVGPAEDAATEASEPKMADAGSVEMKAADADEPELASDRDDDGIKHDLPRLDIDAMLASAPSSSSSKSKSKSKSMVE